MRPPFAPPAPAHHRVGKARIQGRLEARLQGRCRQARVKGLSRRFGEAGLARRKREAPVAGLRKARVHREEASVACWIQEAVFEGASSRVVRVELDGLSGDVQVGGAEKENGAAAAPETIAEEPEAEAAAAETADKEPAAEEAAA